jgi:BirA family biotin operon repressor/biotin-[acetyl-CoA-carboxylase] ligase
MTFDIVAFRRNLTTRRFGREFVWVEEVDSTNRWMAENHARFSMSGGVVAANHQTAGRGRHDRVWHDEPGTALLFSVMLRHPVNRGGEGPLALLPAIALAEVLSEQIALSASVRLKWPNDVLLGDRKVAGILGQQVSRGEPCVSVVGVGVNVLRNVAGLPHNICGQATSIEEAAGTAPRREMLLPAILLKWEGLFDDFLEGRREPIRMRWERFGPPRGTMLTRSEGSSSFAGRFAGLGDDGEIRLADESGTIHEFRSGDIES